MLSVIIFALFVSINAQNHSVLLLLNYNWPEFFDFPYSGGIDHQISNESWSQRMNDSIEWLHPGAVRLTLPISELNTLFGVHLSMRENTWRTLEDPLVPKRIDGINQDNGLSVIRRVVGIDDDIFEKPPHVFEHSTKSNVSPLQLKQTINNVIPSSRRPKVIVVGWDNGYEDFTWKQSDLEYYASGWEFDLKGREIGGNAQGGNAGIQASMVVQLLSILNPVADIEVIRCSKSTALLDFLYDIWFSDPLPEFVVFIQGQYKCDDSEAIMTALRSKGVTFIASATQSNAFSSWPASSKNVIAVGGLDEQHHAVRESVHGYCTTGRSDVSAHAIARIVQDKVPRRVTGNAVSAIVFTANLIDLSITMESIMSWKETIDQVYESRQCPGCFYDITVGECGGSVADYGKDYLTGVGKLNTVHLYWELQHRMPNITKIHNPVWRPFEEEVEVSMNYTVIIMIITSLMLAYVASRPPKRDYWQSKF